MRKTALTILVVAAITGGAGCRLGPDYCAAPVVPLGEGWREVPDSTVRVDHDALAGWWFGFEDPVLDALVEQALAQNLDVREAALRIFEARAQRCIVCADLYPQATQDASYMRNRFAVSTGAFGAGFGGFGVDRFADQWSFGLNGSWEIDVFGRLRRLVEAADAEVDVSVEDYHDTLVLLLADVATNYVDARSFQQRIEIAQENLAIQQRTLDFLLDKFQAELVAELDVAQARANVESTAADIPSLETGYRQSLNRLSLLLGYAPGAVDDMMVPAAAVPSPPAEIAIGIPADLLRRRPDIRLAERALAAQTARIGAATGELYPKFTILGSFGLDARDFSRLFDADSLSASVGPRMQWNILEFGRFRCNVYVQQWREEQRAIQYERAVLRAAEEVDNALTAYSREKLRHVRLSNAVDANRRAVALSQKRYVGGDVSFQRVLDSQRSLLISQDQMALSEARVTANLIQLYRSLGGGWYLPTEAEEIPQPLPQPDE